MPAANPVRTSQVSADTQTSQTTRARARQLDVPQTAALPPKPQHPRQRNPTHNPNEAERERIKDTMVTHGRKTPRSIWLGSLMWHCFCDDRAIPSKEGPQPAKLYVSFVAHMASAYSVRAWHVLHSVPWQLNKIEMDTMLRAAEKLTPASSKRKKRRPYTPGFIVALKQQMNLEEPWTPPLGEFTVRTLQTFDPNTHITTQNLAHDQDRNGLNVTVLHLPRTKMAGNEGEDPPETSHLFAYRAKHARKPSPKRSSSKGWESSTRSGLEPLQGHGIRIGSTLEYLLRGVPFDVMKAKGRWAGDSFLLYLRNTQ
ncbi:hypothetical protein BJV77DRAFT_1028846 [Russula vinacea]|nr:hypothetical protein BJV77DRAFT_1028846 [Russula vinacea]